MVFERDRARFEKLFPQLKVETSDCLPWLAYLLSGGVTMRHLVPGILNAPIRGMEHLLSPVAPALALHWHICVRKSASAARNEIKKSAPSQQ